MTQIEFMMWLEGFIDGKCKLSMEDITKIKEKMATVSKINFVTQPVNPYPLLEPFNPQPYQPYPQPWPIGPYLITCVANSTTTSLLHD